MGSWLVGQGNAGLEPRQPVFLESESCGGALPTPHIAVSPAGEEDVSENNGNTSELGSHENVPSEGGGNSEDRQAGLCGRGGLGGHAEVPEWIPWAVESRWRVKAVALLDDSPDGRCEGRAERLEAGSPQGGL